MLAALCCVDVAVLALLLGKEAAAVKEEEEKVGPAPPMLSRDAWGLAGVLCV